MKAKCHVVVQDLHYKQITIYEYMAIPFLWNRYLSTYIQNTINLKRNMNRSYAWTKLTSLFFKNITCSSQTIGLHSNNHENVKLNSVVYYQQRKTWLEIMTESILKSKIDKMCIYKNCSFANGQNPPRCIEKKKHISLLQSYTYKVLSNRDWIGLRSPICTPSNTYFSYIHVHWYVYILEGLAIHSRLKSFLQLGIQHPGKSISNSLLDMHCLGLSHLKS